MGFRSWAWKVLKAGGLLLAGTWVALLLLALIPVRTGGLVPSPDPAPDYAQSARRIQAVIEGESGRVCDICGTRFLTHGSKTKKAVVLIHGLTNSPPQFLELGDELYAAGYNVLIVRMPYHGLATHTVSELKHVTALGLNEFADESVDMAAGLGEELTVAGLSGGGTITGWIGQNRSDVDKIVLIAPLFGMHDVPPFANNILGNLFSRVPDIDFTSSSEPPRATVYRGWSTRGIAEYLLLAKAVRQQADSSPPRVKDMVFVTNANDHTVNNDINADVAGAWQRSGASITSYQFDKSLGLPHDFIDPTGIGDRKSDVYPELIKLIEGD